MSSHHIVRDNQEPALLVLDSSLVSFDVIEELLEWSPSIIVHESQIDLFLLRGIKIDAVLFEDIHRNEIINKINDQLPVNLLSYHSEGALNRALSFLQDKNHDYVNIVTDSIDFLNQLRELENPKNISVFHQNIRWSLVRSGHFEKWVADKVKIILLENTGQSILYPETDNMIKVKKSESFWIGESLND